MKLIRIKVVSKCIGIRRALACYIPFKDGSYNLNDYEHPLKDLKEVTLNGYIIKILDKEFQLEDFKETNFILTKDVSSLNQNMKEVKEISVLPMDINLNMKDFYIDKLNHDELFDEFKGELEYLLSFIDEANKEYYLKEAKEKGFNYLWN